MKSDETHVHEDDLSAEVLLLLRKITRRLDLRSRELSREHGLTGPQLVVLNELVGNEGNGGVSIGALAERANVSQATITDIADRLERRALVRRVRNTDDRRRIKVQLTENGAAVMLKKPTLLKGEFLEQFATLQRWEQLQILASLERIVEMMEGDDT